MAFDNHDPRFEWQKELVHKPQEVHYRYERFDEREVVQVHFPGENLTLEKETLRKSSDTIAKYLMDAVSWLRESDAVNLGREIKNEYSRH